MIEEKLDICEDDFTIVCRDRVHYTTFSLFNTYEALQHPTEIPHTVVSRCPAAAPATVGAAYQKQQCKCFLNEWQCSKI